MSVLVKGLFSEDARYYGRQHSGVGVATPSRDKSITPPTSIWYPDPSLKDAMPQRLLRFFFLYTCYLFRIRNVVCSDREGYGWYFSTTKRKQVHKKDRTILSYENVAVLFFLYLSSLWQLLIRNKNSRCLKYARLLILVWDTVYFIVWYNISCLQTVHYFWQIILPSSPLT
jgi:hypothetical protein